MCIINCADEFKSTARPKKGNRVGDQDRKNKQKVNAEEDADRLLKIVNHVSRQNVNMCWHCWTCAGGCPFTEHMDLFPNQVIRLVQLGKGEEALRCKTIWICVGCHTCSSHCPNSIDVAAVMDALRQLAIRNGIVEKEPDIYRFHRYIYGSIRRHGRLNKLEAMIQFKVGSGRLFSDLQAGIKMLTRGKLEIITQHVADRDGLGRIFTHYERRRKSFETNERH
jgi:heterodisulfide reductase subunit C